MSAAPAAPDRPAVRRPAGRRDRVLLVTEGTYPHVVGGVSTWCHVVVEGLDDLDWTVLPIVAGDRVAEPRFRLPPHAAEAPPLRIWSVDAPRGRARSGRARRGRAGASDALATTLLANVLGPKADLDALVDVLRWCHDHPDAVRPSFRSVRSWERFTAAMDDLRSQGALPAIVDGRHAIWAYQAMYWIAATATAVVPRADVLLLSAGGWGAITAAVAAATSGMPVLLSEHGLYVREGYLSTVLEAPADGRRRLDARLRAGLSRLAYHVADVVAPVTPSHVPWEAELGAAPATIRPIANGIPEPPTPSPPPGTRTVVSIGRIDPLKDVFTCLHVADEVLRRRPDVRFVHFGPDRGDGDDYAGACRRLHAELGLGAGFRFAGYTADVDAALRDADLLLMTSISEGMPMAVLEAMSRARPVVATAVGGVAPVLDGCGLLAEPGDVDGLAAAVVALVDRPDLARALGARGYQRFLDHYTQDRLLQAYRSTIGDLTTAAAGAGGGG